MNLTQKISQMTPKGADLDATDLIEVSTIVGGSYVTKSITGQELIDAIPLPPSGLTVGTTPISSGTIGRVLFQGTGNVLQQSSSLSFDSAANRFQVGSNVNILAANTFPTNVNSPYVVLGPYNANFGGDQGALFNLTNNNTTGNSAAIFRFGITSPATGAIGEFGATSSTFSGFPNLVFFNTKGTFPLAFLTNDTERLRIHGTTGNVLINTTTDAGFKLDVNGTARVQGNATISLNQNNTTLLTISNTTAGTSSNASLQLTSDASAGQAQVFKYSSTRTAYKTLAANDFGHYNATAGDISFLNDVPNGRIKFATNQSNTVQMTLFATGNIGINTTTDAGFRLDVNGTARVQDNTTITKTQDAITSLSLLNGSTGANASSRFYLGNTQTQLAKLSSGYTSGSILKSGDFFMYNQTVGNITFWNNLSTGNINFTTGSASSPQMTLKPSGVLNLSSVPTSATGLSAGDIWNDAGTLKIV